MQIITPFDPSASVSGTIAVALVNRCAVIYLINESSIGIKLTFADGSTGVVPPWFARAFQLAVPNAPIEWSQLYTLGSTGAPVSIVQGEGYEPNEVEWAQLAQGPLNRQVNVGNTVTTTGGGGGVTTADFLQNDGNAFATQIIEATPLGDTTSAVSLTNDGTLILGNNIHHGMLSSDNAQFKTDGSGNVTAHNVVANGALTVAGNATIASSNLSIPKIVIFTGTSTANPVTVNHNFGGTPAWIGIVGSNSPGGVFRQTRNITATTVDVYTSSSGIPSGTFIGIAIG